MATAEQLDRANHGKEAYVEALASGLPEAEAMEVAKAAMRKHQKVRFLMRAGVSKRVAEGSVTG